MPDIVISNAVVKGYDFQIRPPPMLMLPVTKEYGNKHDPNACLVWVPEIDKIPSHLLYHITDKKRGERVQNIAGLPIGCVSKGFSTCFWKLLDDTDVTCIDW